MWQSLMHNVTNGDFKSLARCISLVENEVDGYEEFLQVLPVNYSSFMIGITGPPGAGKSTLADTLIKSYVDEGKKVGIICVDPSSPFNMGALLGDRIRMSEWYNHPLVFIRSFASRGSLGGLQPKIIEVTDVMRVAGFDIIIVETVGVGQSEIEIAGIADITIVVLVPESGDEIQIMKAGLMEIADIFVVNKSDRPGAELFTKNLRLIMPDACNNNGKQIAIVKTVASQSKGIDELRKAILENSSSKNIERKKWMITEKIYKLIQIKRMKNINKSDLIKKVKEMGNNFNIYTFIKDYN